MQNRLARRDGNGGLANPVSDRWNYAGFFRRGLRGHHLPKNLQADIDWHRARIAFYTQALEARAEASAGSNDAEQQAGLRTIIADLQRTLSDLEKALAQSRS
jgi:hypothetical protein